MVDCVDNGIVLYSSNIVASGTCGAEGNNGDNLTWILDDEGVLTISGTGAMANWNWEGSPWYANKDKIESVVIEDGVTSIGMYAFGDCSSLASIKLPNSISSIGNAAFSNCSSLASITLPNSISSIGGTTFYYCSSLTSITIPNSVTSIGDSAFLGCSNLASITISNSVTSIAGNVFEKCSSLTSITIPNNVISIGKYAFYKCSSLKSITIPNSVTSIGNSAFYDCSSLTSVIYLGTTEQWNAIKKGRSALSSAQLKNVKCHEHSHALAWSNNATYHWHQCTDEACPVKDEPQAQDGCALNEWENGKCRVCGYICKHTGGTATCTKKAVCTECGIEYGEVDSKNHDILHHAAQAPTCTKNGYEAYWKCSKCAKLFSDEAGAHEISNPVEINANGHALEKVEKKEAGCTETGHEAYWKCKNCAKLFSDEAGTDEISKSVEINANGHDLKKVEKKAPTCTEIGWEAYDTCKREGCTYSTYKELPALNHDLEHHEAKAATCTEIGWDAYDICKRDGCKYTTYKELPALGHEDSNNDHLCDACSTKISDHSYESKIAREATTTYTGIRINTCTKCGHSYTEELAKLPSQTNQADQTNQIEPANNGNEKDFIGTVTSVFLNVTDLAAKNFRISFWLMIQMLLKAVMQLW